MAQKQKTYNLNIIIKLVNVDNDVDKNMHGVIKYDFEIILMSYKI